MKFKDVKIGTRFYLDIEYKKIDSISATPVWDDGIADIPPNSEINPIIEFDALTVGDKFIYDCVRWIKLPDGMMCREDFCRIQPYLEWMFCYEI